MRLAVIAFVLSFGAMILSYLFLRARIQSAGSRAQANRVTERDRAVAVVVEKKAPVLIQKDRPARGGPLRKLAGNLRFNDYVSSLIEGAGARTTPTRFLRSCMICGGVSGVAVLAAVPGPLALLAIPVAAACSLLPLWNLRRKKRRRIDAFQGQFPDGLEFVSRSMRAGHAFSVALEMLHREFDEPLAGEFRRIFEEQNLGLPLEIALGKFAQRIPLLDVQFFTSAVMLQRKTGGNLTEILDKLAHLIRDRYKLQGKIKSVSAHGRMTGKALSAIPAGVGLIMFYVNPDYGHFFLMTSTGRQMIGLAIGLQLIGYLVMQKIVKIEV